MKHKKRLILYIILIVVACIGVFGFVFQDNIISYFQRPTGSSLKQGIKAGEGAPEVVASSLTVPWGIAFLPDGDMLVTERSGTLRRIGQDAQAHTIKGVEHVGEGGLLGVALDPQFAANKRLYLYLTTKNGDALNNRIERYTYDGDALTGRQVILQDIPGEANHDGGRIAFGPDGFLYVTTGDAGVPELAQNTASLAGKILRLTPDGRPAPGNPFNNAVYSYGHRNPQGLAWDGNGQLWATEHGPSGVSTGYDELNRIKKGSNYGWPVIKGDETKNGMERPIAHSGGDETWAPAGLAYANGSLFFAGLRGQSLYEAKITSGTTVTIRAHLREAYGRLRTTAVHDGKLYVSTSNTDGRGETKAGDDKIIRFTLTDFQ